MEKLIDAAGAYFAFYLESPRLFRLVALRHGTPSDESTAGPVAVMLAERVDRMTQALAWVIEQGVADGSMRAVVPLDSARFLWGSMNGVIALAQRPDRLRLSDDELRSTLTQGIEILLQGAVADALRGPDGRLSAELRARLLDAVSNASAVCRSLPLSVIERGSERTAAPNLLQRIRANVSHCRISRLCVRPPARWRFLVS